MLAIYSGCNDMAWQMNPIRKAFRANAPQIYFCSICNAVYPPCRFFAYDAFLINCAACEMYVSLLFLSTFDT